MGGPRRQLLVLGAVVIALAAVTAAVWAGEGGDPSAAAPIAASAPAGALDGADVFQAKGCAACHMAPGTGNGFGTGPSLVALPRTAGSRVPGLSAGEYVRESILDPGSFIAAPSQSGVAMPRLEVGPAELDALVAHLLREGG